MIYIILSLAFALRLISINQSFWLDEAIQAYWSKQELSKLPILNDFHPPLFYYITHYYQLIGISSEWFLRLLPVIFGVATIYFSYKIAIKIFNKKSALFSAFLLAVSSYHIYYSQEYRMYSLFALLTVMSWYFLYEKKTTSWMLTSLAAIFTNYFYFLVLFSQIIWVNFFDEKLKKDFSPKFSVIVIFFSFWIPTFWIQFQNAQKLLLQFPKWGDTSGVSFVKFPGLLFAKFSVGMISFDNKIVYGIIVLFNVIVFGLATRFAYKKYKNSNKNIALLLIYFFIPFLMAMISGLFTKANGPWRLLFILPVYYMIIGYYFSNIYKNTYGKIVIGVFIALSIFCSAQYLLNERFHRENWQAAVQYSDKLLDKETVAINTFQESFTPILWYSNISQKYFPKQDLKKILSNKKIIYYSYLWEVFDSQKSIENTLIKNNFKVIDEKDFRGVGIVKVYQK
jgi:uncharacterized membrane protein